MQVQRGRVLEPGGAAHGDYRAQRGALAVPLLHAGVRALGDGNPNPNHARRGRGDSILAVEPRVGGRTVFMTCTVARVHAWHCMGEGIQALLFHVSQDLYNSFTSCSLRSDSGDYPYKTNGL